MLITNKEIAIVGGGPGGLMLARLLQMQGANVKVYERDLDKNARMVGSPLDLHEESGLAAMRKAGLMEEFKRNYRPGADRELIVNERAEVFFNDHHTKPQEDFGNAYFRPEIDRGPLRDMLLRSLQPETVAWDCHFISLERQNDGWLLHFKNGLSAYADIVIGCDGANSKIRPYITDIKPVYSGIIMLEGNVPNAEKAAPVIYSLLNGGKLMAFGRHKTLLMGAKGNGDITFYAGFRAGEDWLVNNDIDYSSKARLMEWFKKEYTEWSTVWYELFENAATPFIPRPIYYMPLDQQWETVPNLTIIGDAAHVMPPFAGEGVNMALLDACELSDCLISDTFDSLEEAISFYEKNMRSRAAIAAKESIENGEKMHAEDGLATMLKFFTGQEGL